jgi:hypothetical protein
MRGSPRIPTRAYGVVSQVENAHIFLTGLTEDFNRFADGF